MSNIAPIISEPVLLKVKRIKPRRLSREVKFKIGKWQVIIQIWKFREN
jgi:hypothetical protein